MTAWLILIGAGIFEILWATGLRYTAGFTKPYPSLIVLALMAVSMYLLALAVKELPVGTAYAVWTGIGAAGTAILGVIFFGEPVSVLRVFFILLILFGVGGLKIIS